MTSSKPVRLDSILLEIYIKLNFSVNAINCNPAILLMKTAPLYAQLFLRATVAAFRTSGIEEATVGTSDFKSRIFIGHFCCIHAILWNIQKHWRMLTAIASRNTLNYCQSPIGSTRTDLCWRTTCSTAFMPKCDSMCHPRMCSSLSIAKNERACTARYDI